MLSNHNPVFLFRRIVSTLRGIRPSEIKLMYLGMIALFGVILLALLLQKSMLTKQAAEVVKPLGIVNFSAEKVRLEDNFPVMKKDEVKRQAVEELSVAKEETAATVAVSENVVEEWYFDEVYQEWRYRNK